MRRAAALIPAALLAAAAIAGCSSSSSTSASAGASASGSYKQVTVTGAFNKSPTVKIPKVTGSGNLYTKTLIQGSGAALTSTTSQGVVGNYVAYDWSGKTSKEIGSSYTTGKPSLFVGQLLPGLESALVGQKAGSRVLAVIPPKDGFGTSGNSSEGIGASDTLVFVIDMMSTFPTTGATGTQAATGNSAVTVTPPASGSTAGPTVKINSKVTPPTKLVVKTLIKGTGAKVVKGDDVALQYDGLIWRTGQVFQSSWSSKEPLVSAVGEGQLIPGMDTGLVGQTVGSRVMLIIPPASGYGKTGASSVGIKGTDTIVFVADILAAQ